MGHPVVLEGRAGFRGGGEVKETPLVVYLMEYDSGPDGPLVSTSWQSYVFGRFATYNFVFWIRAEQQENNSLKQFHFFFKKKER